MDFKLNPLSKKGENEQLTPDLLKPEKDKGSESAEKLELSQQEQISLDGEAVLEKASTVEQDKPGLKKQVASQQTADIKAITLKKIENILQENLEEVYFNMDEAHRRMFKAEGERAAHQIEKILFSGKSVAVKVLEVIKKWLRLIPGVNKFFIEQEAKIKTDKVININHINNNH